MRSRSSPATFWASPTTCSAPCSTRPTDAADPLVKNLAIGLEMTEKELMAAFERNGLKPIDPVRGAKFDPHQHQAMQEQPADDVGAGGVLQVIQPGYELFGRLLRPAMVIVAARGSGGAEAADPVAQNPYAAANDAAGASIDTKACSPAPAGRIVQALPPAAVSANLPRPSAAGGSCAADTGRT